MPLHPTAVCCLLTFALLTTTAPTSKATTIAAVVTSENIVLAADSLATKVSAKGPTGVEFTEKLEAFGPTIVAAGGLAKADNGRAFDVFQLAAQACRNSYGVDAQAQVFADLMRSKLPSVVTTLRTQAGKDAATMPSSIFSTVWFCGLENKRPTIYAVVSEIGLGVQYQTKITIRRYPPSSNPRGCGVVFMGPASLRGRSFDLNPNRLRDLPYLIEEADRVVRTGISDPQGHSGGAVTIVQISRQGNRVISKS